MCGIAGFYGFNNNNLAHGYSASSRKRGERKEKRRENKFDELPGLTVKAI